jgi:predicted Zn-dependent peptidase
MAIINRNYEEYRLDNGLVVALQKTPTQTVAAKLRVNYGSSHERNGEEGMAHFLEHCLVTGGSQKYDSRIADKIRGTFGEFNTYTNIGRTSFVGQILTENFETWLDYVSDHVLKPRLDSERVNSEKERVLREISDAKSDPMYTADEEFNVVFYRGHPKGKYNLGKEKVVKDADSKKIRAFHSKGFHANNMDLIIVGGLPENVEELVGKYFGSTSKGRNTRKEFPKIKSL